MSEWYMDWCNDPDNDYDLLIEVLYNGRDVALICQPNQRLAFTWYACDRDLLVPLNVLIKLMEKARDGLPAAQQEYKNYQQLKSTGQLIEAWATSCPDGFLLPMTILHNDKVVGTIEQKNDGLFFVIYAHNNDFSIPFYWLFEVLQDAQDRSADLQ